MHVFFGLASVRNSLVNTWVVADNPRGYEVPELTNGNDKHEAIISALGKARYRGIDKIHVHDKMGQIVETIEVK